MTSHIQEGEDFLTCVVEHFQEDFWLQTFFLLAGIAVASLIVYLAVRRHQALMAFQGSLGGFAVFLIPTALCKVLGPVLLYSLAILGGTLLILAADLSVARRLRRLSFPKRLRIGSTGREISVNLIASQRAFAFTFHRRIYVSVGLLEALGRPELEAVLRHEEHHATRGPSPLLASFLALVSFTFRRATGEEEAHGHARRLCGENALLRATSVLLTK